MRAKNQKTMTTERKIRRMTRVRAKLSAEEILEAILNSVFGRTADINQEGNEEMTSQVDKEHGAEVIIYVNYVSQSIILNDISHKNTFYEIS